MEAAVAAYAQRVRETWGHLDLEVLLPLDDQGRHPAIRLREIFVEAGVRADPPPVELPRELVRRLVESGELPEGDQLPTGALDALKELQEAYDDRPTSPVLQVLGASDTRKHVVLGDPGAGKSTLAKFLALTLAGRGDRSARHHIPEVLADRIGIIVELRQYAEPQWYQRTYEDFLAHRQDQLGLCVPPPVLTHLLSTGRALLVFDGLDEVFDPKVRQAASEQIAAFAARWPLARIVVTSRVIGYKRHVFDGADFTHFMLQDLDQGQIATFTDRWYTLSSPADPEQAARLSQRLQDAVRDSRPIRELAGNPLLLTILAIVGRRQPLPKDRLGVYRQAVTVLTAQWDQQAKHLEAALPPGIKDVLDGLDREEVLMMLARAMQAGTSGIAGNHIHGDDLTELLRSHLQEYGLPPGPARTGAQALVSQLRERNFILARYGSEVYGFVHRAFLEHLAAADIYERYTRGRAWTPEGLLDQVVARHAHDPAWHEVLLLLIGRLEPRDAAAAVDRLVDLHDGRTEVEEAPVLVLAIRALAEVPKIGRLNRQSVRAVQALTRLLNHASPSLNGLSPALASFGAYWVGREAFLSWFRTRGQFSPSPETPRLVCRLEPSRSDLMRFARHAYADFDRRIFIEALAERWPHDADVQAALFDMARNDLSAGVRESALSALCDDVLEPEKVRELVLHTVREDENGNSRHMSLYRLREVWFQDDAVRAVIGGVAREDGQPNVRWAALQILIGTDPETADARPMLRELVREGGMDADAAEHAEAVERWAGRIDGEALVSQLSGPQRDLDPQWAVLRLLAETCPGDADVRRLLFALARRLESDSGGHFSGDAGAAALFVLAETWRHDPALKELLLERARNAAGWRVRETALNLLVQHWREDEEVYSLCLDVLGEDEDPDVHNVALQALGEVWRQGGDRSLRLLEAGRDDDRRRVRREVLRMVARNWPGDAEMRALIRSGPADDKKSTLQLMVNYWTSDTEIFEMLSDFMGAGEEGERRRAAAVELLARYRQETGDARALLEQLLLSDEPALLRRTALDLLVVCWRDDPEVRVLVLGRAREDESTQVRRAALRLLLGYWSDDTEVHLLLLEQARQAPQDWDPGAAALDAFALRWQQDESVRPLFLELARHGTEATREKMVVLLADRWSQDAEARAVLMSMASSERTDDAQERALHAVAEHWPDDAEVRDVITEVAGRAKDAKARTRSPYADALCVIALAGDADPDADGPGGDTHAAAGSAGPGR
ncbi:HEAT repeat domain-containing protein [Streptomyces sp. NPDC049813]|uniref:HEAT repeat domain-containing protein n=1 Tax=Streptomyces sp. NPDC049813 TaxID=3365597 RepID=UPI00378967B9